MHWCSEISQASVEVKRARFVGCESLGFGGILKPEC